MKLIDVANLLLFLECGEYDCIEDIVKFINDNTIQAIPISDNATNGDMMKHIFSNVPVKIFEDMNTVIFGNTQFDLEWWNAPYRKE